MEAVEVLEISKDAKGEADTKNARPYHDELKKSTEDPNSYAKLGTCAVTAGFIGRGKLIPTNSSTRPHDANLGLTLADGKLTRDTICYLSRSSHGTAS